MNDERGIEKDKGNGILSCVVGSKPTAIEKNNLPEDVRYAFNEGVDLYQCIQNYEMGNLTNDVFINYMCKIKERYKKTKP